MLESASCSAAPRAVVSSSSAAARVMVSSSSAAGVDQSLINQLESIIIAFIKYQNQSMAADEKNG